MKSIKELLVLIARQNTVIKENANNYSLLTKRERELVHYLSKGYPEFEITREMKIKPGTFSTYKRKAFNKLKINSIDELFRDFSTDV